MEKRIHNHKDKTFSIGTAKKAPLQKVHGSFLQETSHLFFSCLTKCMRQFLIKNQRFSDAPVDTGRQEVLPAKLPLTLAQLVSRYSACLI